MLATTRARIDMRLGMLEYRLRPRRRETWEGPFNGQAFRQRMFDELCTGIDFAAIIETGTYRGTTTAHLRQRTTIPVHSFELQPRDHGFARARLRKTRDLHLHREDSREGIAALAGTPSRSEGPVFFYLDAHWEDDLPLREEVDLAFTHWRQAVVMVDDFAVPDDPGYGFDDYGAGKALTLAYLGAAAADPVAVWFPACASRAETGAQRGCVVLARDAELIRRIDLLTTLRRWPPARA